jgi:hypothetical protein
MNETKTLVFRCKACGNTKPRQSDNDPTPPNCNQLRSIHGIAIVCGGEYAKDIETDLNIIQRQLASNTGNPDYQRYTEILPVPDGRIICAKREFECGGNGKGTAVDVIHISDQGKATIIQTSMIEWERCVICGNTAEESDDGELTDGRCTNCAE